MCPCLQKVFGRSLSFFTIFTDGSGFLEKRLYTAEDTFQEHFIVAWNVLIVVEVFLMSMCKSWTLTSIVVRKIPIIVRKVIEISEGVRYR